MIDDEIREEITELLIEWAPETVGISYLELLAKGEWEPNKTLKSIKLKIYDTSRIS